MKAAAASAIPAASLSVPDLGTPESESNTEWEALCHRCGQCCFEKTIDRQGTIHPTAVPCRFLDIHSRQCRVYHQRQLAESDCIRLTPEIVAEACWLPDDCAYRAFILRKS